MTVTVTIKNDGAAARRLRAIAAKIGNGGAVKVGFLEGATYPGKTADDLKAGRKVTGKNARQRQTANLSSALPVATVAFWNEFGTSTAPARPFFRQTIAAESPKWGKRMAAVLKAANYDTGVALGRMGEGIKDQIVKAIVDWPADNAARTEQAKGFNKGLIDTGVMQRSVDYKVEK